MSDDNFWDEAEAAIPEPEELPPFLDKAEIFKNETHFAVKEIRGGANNFGKDSVYLDCLLPETGEFGTLSFQTGNKQRDLTVDLMRKFLEAHPDQMILAQLTKLGRSYQIVRVL